MLPRWKHTFSAERRSILKPMLPRDVIVHQVIGRQHDAFYHADTLNKVYQETKARFDRHVSTNLFVVDVNTDRIQGNCGIAWYDGDRRWYLHRELYGRGN